MFSVSHEPARVLDFDTECRPMHYNEWRPESQITAIAWSWGGEPSSAVLEPDAHNEARMLALFLGAYSWADVVTGHYIRKHDLPLLNDALVRLGMGTLPPKMVSDTQADLTAVKGLGKSQDNLAVTFGLTNAKHHMTGADWRQANQLSQEGIELARTRVVSDVKQHMELRRYMIDLGLLKPPRMWRP